MIRINPQIEKPYWNFRGSKPTPEEVGSYLKELKQNLKSIEKMPWRVEEAMNLNTEYKKKVIDSFEDMINLCKFYFEIRRRKRKGELFVWDSKKEELTGYGEHTYQTKETRTCSNGKIKYIIQIKRGEGKMTLIESWHENDTRLITFDWNDYPYSKRTTKHLKSEKSIKEYIEILEQRATETFKEYEFPRSHEREKEFMEALYNGEE